MIWRMFGIIVIQLMKSQSTIERRLFESLATDSLIERQIVGWELEEA